MDSVYCSQSGGDCFRLCVENACGDAGLASNTPEASCGLWSCVCYVRGKCLIE